MLDNALSSSRHKMLRALRFVSTQQHHSENSRVMLEVADQKAKKTTNCTLVTYSGDKFSIAFYSTSLHTHPPSRFSDTRSFKGSWSTCKGALESSRCSVQSNRIYLAKLEDFTSKVNVLVKT